VYLRIDDQLFGLDASIRVSINENYGVYKRRKGGYQEFHVEAKGQRDQILDL
jgi:hypothetical protein